MKRIAGLSLVVALLLSLAGASDAGPYRFDREGRWQFSIPIGFVAGKSFEGKGGSGLDVSDDLGWGFGFGYHFNERLMLGAEFTWMSANYQASIPVDDDGNGMPDRTARFGGILDVGTIQGVLQLNLLERRQVTPFLRGGLGFSLLDSNIPAGPSQGVCWWDPWLGYVCDVYQPTYGRTSFTLGAGAGARFQLGDQFYLEGSANGSWVDMPEGMPFFVGGRLTLGWMF